MNRRAERPSSAPNIALWLTWARIALAPLFVVVFLHVPGRTGAVLALVVALLSELTDVCDGMVARRMGTVTDLGKILDPLADSVSRLTIFICLVKAGIAPLELVLLILYRDSVVATIRTVCASKGVVVAARWSGKLKAIVQAGGILAILALHAVFGPAEPDWLAKGYAVVLAVITVVTVSSGIDYVTGTWRVLSPALRGR